MKRLLLLGLVPVLALTLAGCDDPAEQNRKDEKERYALCLEHGGTYVEDYGNGWECYLPGVDPSQIKK